MNRFRTAEWHVDPQGLRLDNGKTKVRIGARAMAVLCYLVERQGEVVTKDTLLEEVWNGQAVTDDVLTVAVYELRKALGDRARAPTFIETIHGRGYRWLSPITPRSPEEPASTIPDNDIPSSLSSSSNMKPDDERWARVIEDPSPSSRSLASRAPRWGWAVVVGILILAGWAGSAHLRSSAGNATPEIASLAVLPLADYSDGSPHNGTAFADGMTAALINALARQGLPVSANSSVLPFRDQPAPLAKIAEVLDVDALIEGSVRRSSSRVAVEVQLVDPGTGRVLWAGREEVDVEAALGVGRQLAPAIRAVVSQRPEVDFAAPTLARRSRVHPRLIDRYLEARAALRRGELEIAVLGFEQVRQEDPSFVENLAGLAEARLTRAEIDPGAVGEWKAAQVAAEEALKIDPELAAPRAVLGVTTLFLEWDLEHAQEQLQEALHIHPSLSLAYQYDSSILSLRGRHDEAIAQARRAVKIDPLNTARRTSLAWIQLFADRPAEVMATLDDLSRVREATPSWHVAQTTILRGMALEQLGRDEEAWRVHRSRAARWGFDEEELQALERQVEMEGIDAYYGAVIERYGDGLRSVVRAYFMTRAGDHEGALRLFEHAVEARDPDALWIGLVPHTRRLRPLPRFRDLLARLPS